MSHLAPRIFPGHFGVEQSGVDVGPKIVYRGLICVKARSSRYMNHFATQRSPLLIFHGTLLAPVVVGYFTFVELFGIAMVLAYI